MAATLWDASAVDFSGSGCSVSAHSATAYLADQKHIDSLAEGNSCSCGLCDMLLISAPCVHLHSNTVISDKHQP